MRSFLVFLAVVAALVILCLAAGIIRWSVTPERLNISVETGRVQRQAQKAVHNAGQKLDPKSTRPRFESSQTR